MRISAVQMASGTDVRSNSDTAFDLLMQSMKNEPDLVIFPEYQMLAPDYSDLEGTKGKFEPETGEFVSRFRDFSMESSVSLLINYSELSDGRHYNTSVFIVDGSISLKYRKTHLFDAYSYMESDLYERGDTIPEPVKLRGFSISPLICYDIRFPELARACEEKGADVLIYQAGWYTGKEKLELWKSLLRSRATETSCFAIGAAQCGSAFTGHTVAFSPFGTNLGELENENGILNFEIDHNTLEKFRREVPLRQQRRPDLY